MSETEGSLVSAGRERLWQFAEQSYEVFSLEDTDHCESTLELAETGNTAKAGKLRVIIFVMRVPGKGSFRCFTVWRAHFFNS